MKHKIIFGFTPVLCLFLLLAACNKQTDPSKTASTDAEIASHTDDENRVSEEINAIIADANVVLESDHSLSGDAATVTEMVCDASVVVNSNSDPMTATITYNGANCGGLRKRTGVVVISMAKNTKWKDAGAALTVTCNELKITRTKDNKSIILNGSQTLTNVSGGLLGSLFTQGEITHTLAGDDLSITFDNHSKRSWHVAKKCVYTFNNGVVLTISGTHTEANVPNIAEWGLNRFGNAFTTAITGALVIRQDCNFRLTSGEVTHTTPEFTAVVTFGLDISGVGTGCPGEGHYYYKLGCTRKDGNPFEIVLPY